MKAQFKSLIAFVATFAFICIFGGVAHAQGAGGGNGTGGSSSGYSTSGSGNGGNNNGSLNGSGNPNAVTPSDTSNGQNSSIDTGTPGVSSTGNTMNTTNNNQGGAPGTTNGAGADTAPHTNSAGWWILGIVCLIAIIWAIAASTRRADVVTPTRV